MHRITPSTVNKLANLILSRQTSLLTKPIHTSTVILKWGDAWVPADLKKYEDGVPKDYKEHPDRDLVNFPHPVSNAFPAKVRYGIFPDSWFAFFYPKTGVTGPYLFYGGLGFYLAQKEWWIINEEIRVFWIFAMLFFIVYKTLGPKIAQSYGNHWRAIIENAEKYVEINKSSFQNAITTQKEYVSSYTALPSLIAESKRENLQLQLEAEYRRRLVKAHNDVKRRLDYMADMEEAKRRFQRRYMIDWIVDQVKKSITPQTEKALLSQCVSDLKGLSARSNIG